MYHYAHMRSNVRSSYGAIFFFNFFFSFQKCNVYLIFFFFFSNTLTNYDAIFLHYFYTLLSFFFHHFVIFSFLCLFILPPLSNPSFSVHQNSHFSFLCLICHFFIARVIAARIYMHCYYGMLTITYFYAYAIPYDRPTCIVCILASQSPALLLCVFILNV
ncbi:hypothetical protein PVIIG_00994 [Plasmodium vivax India VII]|uniref:Uncharacterized protein n=2 Tax=Plasmodium vivax TaxID=5855 RepID=A0A0J9TVR1_PLAVI|nr:hypothetical protein PVIIG_00994 [Plasmodium vivax India VII]KMZ98917.1 hypothetical protein PVNG_00711 [Plasmodium vivax North Korean]